MDGWLIALGFFTVLVGAHTVTEVYKAKAKMKREGCVKTQELEELKKRVEALEQTLTTKEA